MSDFTFFTVTDREFQLPVLYPKDTFIESLLPQSTERMLVLPRITGLEADTGRRTAKLSLSVPPQGGGTTMLLCGAGSCRKEGMDSVWPGSVSHGPIGLSCKSYFLWQFPRLNLNIKCREGGSKYYKINLLKTEP